MVHKRKGCQCPKGSDVRFCLGETTNQPIEEKWNENVETCSDCGIQWKKIGKSCQVCFAPAEPKHDEPSQKSWQEEFDKTFEVARDQNDHWNQWEDSVKSFISKVREEAVLEERRRVAEEVKGRKSKPSYGVYTTLLKTQKYSGKEKTLSLMKSSLSSIKNNP